MSSRESRKKNMDASHVKITSPNELSRIKPFTPHPIIDFAILRESADKSWEIEFEAMLAESAVSLAGKQITSRESPMIPKLISGS